MEIAADASIDAKQALSEIDGVRKNTHDATIDAINIVPRHLKKKKRGGDWITRMSGNRVAYGKFALLVTFERMKEVSA